MDRRDFYFKQLVTADEMDEVFDLAETADHDLVLDTDTSGVYQGLDVLESGPSLNVEVLSGRAYDKAGQRTDVTGAQIVDLSQTTNAVSTAVAGPNHIRTITIYVKFKRVLSNPKLDGNNVVIQYNRDESFEFFVEQSNEVPLPGPPVPPAVLPDALIIADVTRVTGQITFVNADIDASRREDTFNITAGSLSIQEGTLKGAVQANLQVLSDHINNFGNAHDASAIAYDGGPPWADGTLVPASDLNDVLDNSIIGPLASIVDGDSGAAKIGGQNVIGVPAAVVAAPVMDQIIELLGHHNAHLNQDPGAHAAQAIINVPAGAISSIEVQGAINELDTEKGGLAQVNQWANVNTFLDSVSFLAPTSLHNIIRIANTNTAGILAGTALQIETFAFTSPGLGVFEIPKSVLIADRSAYIALVLMTQSAVALGPMANQGSTFFGLHAFYKDAGIITPSYFGEWNMFNLPLDPLGTVGSPPISLINSTFVPGNLGFLVNPTLLLAPRNWAINMLLLNIAIP